MENRFIKSGIEDAVFKEELKDLIKGLMEDFMSLIASFSGKFYRLRGYKEQEK